MTDTQIKILTYSYMNSSECFKYENQTFYFKSNRGKAFKQFIDALNEYEIEYNLKYEKCLDNNTLRPFAVIVSLNIE